MAKNSTLQTVWRAALLVVCFGVVGAIIYRYYGVNGQFEAIYIFDEKATIISEFTPKGRALDREVNAENGGTYQRIVAEPVYFSVDLPSAYPEATVEIEYQNPNHPLLELGIQYAEVNDQPQFRYETIENKYVEHSAWDRIESGGLVLLQHNPTYETIDEFIAAPPNGSVVGTWRSNLNLPFTFDNYSDQPGGVDIRYPLRGGHEFSTYVKDQSLTMDISYVDANLSTGEDPILIQITRLGAIIQEYSINDDGEDKAVSVSSGEQEYSFSLPGLAEGVYGITVQTTDDVILTSVETELDKLVIKNKVHLAGSPEYHNVLPELSTERSVLYTESDYVSAIAKHSYGVSTLTMNKQPFYVHTVDQVYAWQSQQSRQFTEIVVPNNDVQLVADHYFSVSEDSWFDPEFGFRELTTQTIPEELDYIISKQYTEPEVDKNWLLSSTKFDLSTISTDDASELYFSISARGLEDSPRDIKVRKITVRAEKESITWKNLWQRIKAKL